MTRWVLLALAAGCATPRPGSAPWSCPATERWGTTPAADGRYALTAFGCWVDADGRAHGDRGDNCIPACLAEARRAGLCLPNESGPECERRVTWFTADAARFGCLARVKITEPRSGRAVVAVALDLGPACRVERSIAGPVLDASGRVNRALFGSDQGAVDRAMVEVELVDAATPLGEVSAASP